MSPTRLATAVVPRLPSVLQRVVLRWINASGHKYRQLRARLLRQKSEELRDLCRHLGFEQSICISVDHGVSVESKGIRLSCEGTNRYFKVPGAANGNEGAEQLEILRELGIDPKRIIDIGSNFGEIALYFAKFAEDSEVLAIEASPENVRILRHNISMHEGLAQRIHVEDVAVGDVPGTVEITSGLGSENSLMLTAKTSAKESSRSSRSVKMRSLTQIVENTPFTRPDYVKVDIEGSEPLLTDGLCRLQPNAMLIEYSYKNTPEAYSDLTKALLALGYRTMTEKRELIDVPAFIAEHSKDRLNWNDDFVSIDLWFFQTGPKAAKK